MKTRNILFTNKPVEQGFGETNERGKNGLIEINRF